jgi:hypothetical protein
VHAAERAGIVTGMRWIASLGCALLLACDAAPSASATAAPSNPFAANALQKSQRFSFDARVEERVPAGGYLYLRVRDGSGAVHWVATLRGLAPDGDAVRVRVMARAEHFRSPRLGRDFNPLLFVALSAGQSSERNASP